MKTFVVNMILPKLTSNMPTAGPINLSMYTIAYRLAAPSGTTPTIPWVFPTSFKTLSASL